MIPRVRPAPLSAWMVVGSISATAHPSAISCGRGSSGCRGGAKKGGVGTSCQAGRCRNTSARDGSFSTSKALRSSLILATCSAEGGRGAGNAAAPKVNMTSTGIGR